MNATTATRYQRTFHGRADQVREVRHDLAAHLDGCPVKDEALLVVSELAANAVLHSGSAGEFFTVRCAVHCDHVRVEVEDLGGAWHRKPADDRPHGLDIIQALAGPGNWGTGTTCDGDRVVWARLKLPGTTAPGWPVPDPARPHDVSGLTAGELERTRRELHASLALARPDSLTRVPILAHLSAVDSELAWRASRQG